MHSHLVGLAPTLSPTRFIQFQDLCSGLLPGPGNEVGILTTPPAGPATEIALNALIFADGLVWRGMETSRQIRVHEPVTDPNRPKGRIAKRITREHSTPSFLGLVSSPTLSGLFSQQHKVGFPHPYGLQRLEMRDFDLSQLWPLTLRTCLRLRFLPFVGRAKLFRKVGLFSPEYQGSLWVKYLYLSFLSLIQGSSVIIGFTNSATRVVEPQSKCK